MKKRPPLPVDDVAREESFEAPVTRAYRNRSFHRARDVGVYDVDRLLGAHAKSLTRSAQEFLVSASGLKRRLFWTNLLFERPDGIFWHVLIKGGGGHGAGFDGTYTVVVTAPTAAVAAAEITSLQKEYGHRAPEDGPGFYLLKGTLAQPLRVPLAPSHAMDETQLDLHYGEDFRKWAKHFVEGLGNHGLTILRGKPGTGKTTFLRHVICHLQETHRFYYVPVEAYNILSSNDMPGLFAREERQYPGAVKVLVFEDAEQLIAERGDGGARVSSLLNLTDGFMSDLVKVHLICTINCDLHAIDEAILRPGRQKFFREFELIPFDRACQLAQSLGVELTERRDYSLADLYHFRDVAQAEGGLMRKKEAKPIGFQVKG